jgi:hypothetical protein
LPCANPDQQKKDAWRAKRREWNARDFQARAEGKGPDLNPIGGVYLMDINRWRRQ